MTWFSSLSMLGIIGLAGWPESSKIAFLGSLPLPTTATAAGYRTSCSLPHHLKTLGASECDARVLAAREKTEGLRDAASGLYLDWASHVMSLHLSLCFYLHVALLADIARLFI